MKKFSLYLLLSAAIVGSNAIAMKKTSWDPFEKANQLYNESKWKEALSEFKQAHKLLKSEDSTNRDDIFHHVPGWHTTQGERIRGHVNYGDVLFAHGVTKWNEGDREEAEYLMLKACKHWKHRLEGRQFGRAPLTNEWDGSNAEGRTILVYCERPAGGAFGDTFYMTPMLRWLKEKGAHVIFVPQKALAKLYTLEGTKQSNYVDEIVLHGETLPEHDSAIYLWSLLTHYLKDNHVEKPFPMTAWLSGGDVSEFTSIIEQRIAKFKIQHDNLDPFIVGGWWRSAGTAALAADYRTLNRDPGAQRILSVVEGLPVLFINLEGLGRRPLSEQELQELVATNQQGNSDPIDVTHLDTSHVINFPAHFDQNVPFADTLGIMEYIKNKNGVLIGCDTGLCNAAAGVETPSILQSVLVVLNAKADMRWGIDKTSPREWHHSGDVLIFQAQEQNDWNTPLAQMRDLIQDRIILLQDLFGK